MDDQSARTLNDLMTDMAAKAKSGAEALRLAGPEVRTRAILEAAKAIRAREATILAANEKDQQFARDKGLTDAMIERLILNPARVEAMAKGLEDVASLPDPVGRDLARWTRPNGLDIARVSTPIGVIAIIYESRPNVTADAAALCIRSSNAAILRTGSEALNSALAIYAAFEDGFRAAGLPDTCAPRTNTSPAAPAGRRSPRSPRISISTLGSGRPTEPSRARTAASFEARAARWSSGPSTEMVEEVSVSP